MMHAPQRSQGGKLKLSRASGPRNAAHIYAVGTRELGRARADDEGSHAREPVGRRCRPRHDGLPALPERVRPVPAACRRSTAGRARRRRARAQTAPSGTMTATTARCRASRASARWPVGSPAYGGLRGVILGARPAPACCCRGGSATAPWSRRSPSGHGR